MIVTSITGTRPNKIKCAALHPHLGPMGIEHRILDTGQHYSENMHNVVSLAVNEYGGLKNNIGGMIEWLLPRLVGAVIVYGDTNTSLAGAIAAKQRRLKLFHVEAGLRCGDRNMLEELNRMQIDSISDLNFLTSSEYEKNVPSGTGVVVGDVMYDLFLSRKNTAHEEGYPLLTLHREEHTQDAQRFRDLLDLVKSKFEFPVVFPVHPRTLAFCVEHKISLEGFQIRDPLNYDQFQDALFKSSVVITDSGGVSKEAVWATKPVYVLRDKSEWGLDTVGAWGERWHTVRSIDFKLESGDGKACEKIARTLHDRSVYEWSLIEN